MDDFQRELAEVESIGWQPLEPGVNMHVRDSNPTEVLLVGVPEAGDAMQLMM